MYAGRRSAGAGSPGHRLGEEGYKPSSNPTRGSISVADAVILLYCRGTGVICTGTQHENAAKMLQLQWWIVLQIVDNILIEHRILHSRNRGNPFAAILRRATTVKYLLVFSTVINEDITVMVDATCSFQRNIYIRILLLKIIELCLVKTVVNVIAENGDFDTCSNQFKKHQQVHPSRRS